MKRFTRGYLSGNYATLEQKCDCGKSMKLGFYNAINKLGKLEDIEENFGITWEILVQACTKGFWTSSAFIEPKNNEITKRVFFIDVLHKQIVEYLTIAGDAKCPENRSFWCYKFEDYGKKTAHGWALTQEEFK